MNVLRWITNLRERVWEARVAEYMDTARSLHRTGTRLPPDLSRRRLTDPLLTALQRVEQEQGH